MISHERRLLDNEFTCSRLDETPAQFAARMEAVQAFMNSPGVAREGGGRGLAGLARELRSRCELVISRKGERHSEVRLSLQRTNSLHDICRRCVVS